jgi:hypothetical protein
MTDTAEYRICSAAVDISDQARRKSILYLAISVIICRCNITSRVRYAVIRNIDIEGIMPEGRTNKMVDLQETEFIRIFGLAPVHYQCSYTQM